MTITEEKKVRALVVAIRTGTKKELESAILAVEFMLGMRGFDLPQK